MAERRAWASALLGLLRFLLEGRDRGKKQRGEGAGWGGHFLPVRRLKRLHQRLLGGRADSRTDIPGIFPFPFCGSASVFLLKGVTTAIQLG